MAIIAYLSVGIPLFIIPLLIDEYKNNKFTMFHVEQAIVLLLFSYIWIIPVIFIAILTCGIGTILIFVPLVLHILGIIYAATGNVKELPVIGHYGEKFNLIRSDQ